MSKGDETEEMLKRLSGLLGTWQKPSKPDGDINISNLTILKKQEELLHKLQSMLQKQVDQDLKKIDDLKEKAERLKHGGGS